VSSQIPQNRSPLAKLRGLVFLTLLLTLACYSIASGRTNSVGQEVLDDDAFLAGVQAGRKFENCEIHLSALAKALALATNPAAPLDIQLRGSTISTDEFEGFDLAAHDVYASITMVDSEIQNLPMSSMNFVGGLNFRECKFTGPLEFQAVRFRSSPRFVNCVFREINLTDVVIPSLKLAHNQIQTDVTLEKCQIALDLDFQDVVLRKLQLKEITVRMLNLKRAKIGTLEFKDADCTMHADFSNATFSDPVIVENCRFHQTVWFRDSKFSGFVGMRNVTFDSDLYFEGGNFQKSIILTDCHFGWYTAFNSGEFMDELRVTGCDLDNKRAVLVGPPSLPMGVLPKASDGCQMLFCDVQFHAPVIIQRLTGTNGIVAFHAARFENRAEITDCRLEGLLVSVPEFRTIFKRDASFQNTEARLAHFSGAEFNEDIFLDDAKINRSLNFADSKCRKNVFLRDCLLPRNLNDRTNGIMFDKAAISGGIHAEWSAFSQPGSPGIKVITDSPRTWATVEEAFRRASNLEGQCGALYERRFLETKLSRLFFARASNWWSWLFWGYGVRPGRVTLWSIGLFAVSFWIYWTQTSPLSERNGSQVWTARIRYTLSFTWQTLVKPFFGWNNSTSPFFKAYSLFASVAFKLCILFFLQGAANISPLLNSVASKLLAF